MDIDNHGPVPARDFDHVVCPECGSELQPHIADNLGIVRAFYAALAAQDQDRVLEILHPDVEWIQNDGFPGGGRHVGARTVLTDVFAHFAVEWEDWRAEVRDWLDAPADGAVVALGAYSGTCRRTGRSMRAAFAHVYRLYDSRIVRFEQYADTAKVAEAVE